MSLGPAEIMMVLLVALVLFGPKKLPEVGRQVGGALRELRKIQDTVTSEVRTVLDDTMAPVHRMTSHPSATPVVNELPAGEPDLGDEQQLPTPDPGTAASAASVADDSERPGIDGLSGGTFS